MKQKRSRRAVISGLITAMIIIILIPLYLLNRDGPNNDTLTESGTEEKSNEEQSNQIETDEDSNINDNENVDSSIETNAQSNQTDQNAKKNDEPKEDKLKETSPEELKNYVTGPIPDESMIIYGAVPDEQGQYVIPISLIVSSDKAINDYYNQIDQLLLDAGMDVSNYLLKDLNYSIDPEKHEVTLDVPNDFSLSSSTEAFLFESMLEKMFVPLEIDHITFSANEGIDLGPIGTINELALQADSKENFKIYDNQYLIPVPLDEGISIDDAITDMKISDGEFNLTATIPREINFSSEIVENELVLSVENHGDVSNQEVLTMVEAILMTAKSFGFDTVKFENMPIQQMAHYDLKKPLKVPKGVNPFFELGIKRSVFEKFSKNTFFFLYYNV